MYKAVFDLKVKYKNEEVDNRKLEFFVQITDPIEDVVKAAHSWLLETSEFKSLAIDFNILDITLSLVKCGRTDEGIFFIPQ